MFSHQEQQAIALKAIEQARRAAELAHIAPGWLVPTGLPSEAWPFPLSGDDYVFLKIQKINPA